LLDTIDNRNILANKIIEYRPEIILIPSMNDRHPDHEATALLIKNAIFYAGLKNRND
jgi:LmbE family N-acetylglucosaminyl deacetylase